MNKVGITAYGTYVPRLRVSRAAIASATAWLDPSIVAKGTGEKAVCNWDEDTVTMAVEAARNCLESGFSGLVTSVSLGTTTSYFDDRANAAVVAEALGLGAMVGTAEYCGSRRSATTALISGFGSASLGDETLVIGSDQRHARPGSPQELTYGHGAAAVTIASNGEPIARYINHHSIAHDLVDIYRSRESGVDYVLEERWAREKGWFEIVPAAIESILSKANIQPNHIHHTIIPAPSQNVAAGIAKRCGLSIDTLAESFHDSVGDTGAAHPVLMLAACLADSKPGEFVLLIGFGQGCDALLLQVTDAMPSYQLKRGPLNVIKNRKSEENYLKYLAFSDQVSVHTGMRAEHDKRTAHTVAHRKRAMIAALAGGKCSVCETVQFPLTRACVNPNCRAFDTQELYSLRDSPASVKTFTEDWLAFCPCPPLMYGNIQFANGANIMMEITDTEPGQLSVGLPVHPVFRIKDTDERRHFRRYFWKVAPNAASKG